MGVCRQVNRCCPSSTVSKSFGSTHALRGVTIDLHPGEVHALVGENGAGKSTLIKIITGLYRPDSGTVHVDGGAVELRSAADAQALGIACIYQEPLVFPDLSVSENIFMNSSGAAGSCTGATCIAGPARSCANSRSTSILARWPRSSASVPSRRSRSPRRCRATSVC